MSITGLAGLKAEKKRREQAAEDRNRPKAAYFNWKNNQNREDKNVAYVRFLQEVDSDIETDHPERGVALMQVEHTAPGKEGFKRRANCTLETEGQCYPCERHPEDRKLGWGQKSNFYIWVLVDYQDGNGPVPVVVSRSFGSSFVEDLIEFVEEDENNKITDKMFKITKSGTGLQTQWKLRPAKGVELYDDTDVEILSLDESVLRHIPYDDQAAYYGAVYKDGDPTDNDDDVAPAAEPTPARTEGGPIKW